MTRTTRVLGVTLLLATVACGPTSAELLKAKQPEAAFCAVASDQDVALVVPALLDEFKFEWRVRQLTPADVPALDPALAKEVFDGYVFLVVETRNGARKELELRTLNRLSRLGSVSDAKPTGEGAMASMVISPSDFAGLTGETTPEAKEVKEVVHSVPWAIVTLGASLLFDGKQQTVTHPTDEERRRAAPRSAAIYDALVRVVGSRDLVVIGRGSGEYVARVEAQLIVSNNRGAFPDDCEASLSINLEGQPFSLSGGEVVATEFRAFPTDRWVGSATIAQHPKVYFAKPAR